MSGQLQVRLSEPNYSLYALKTGVCYGPVVDDLVHGNVIVSTGVFIRV